MSFLSTPRKNAACETGAKGHVEMEKEMGERECSGNVGKFILEDWEKSKRDMFYKEVM